MNRFTGWLVVLATATLLSSRLPAAEDPTKPSPLEWIKVSADGSHFVGAATNAKFVVWGVNYDHDAAERLLEDYWEHEWATVEEDFAEIKALGANVVRVHLQVGRFMETADRPNAPNLERLAKLVQLAEKTGLYLDVTGLGCYHKQDVPKWYDELGEAARWDVQARFWQAVAKVCRESPAIFCYDLMNEPVPPGEKDADWLVGEPLGGKYFVQRISREIKGRSREQVAGEWVKKLTSAIHEVDSRHLITVGVIPWAQIFKGAKPVFYSPDVHGPLDFVSVHYYPRKEKLADDLEALAAYDVGKPIVIEEIFPLNASLDETHAFIEGSKKHAEGWVSFYWGATIEQYETKDDLTSGLIGAWLKYFKEHAPKTTPTSESR